MTGPPDSRSHRLGGLEIDDEFESAWQHDRQVAGLLALENPAGVIVGLAKCIRSARS
jgi:hypothetical protein